MVLVETDNAEAAAIAERAPNQTQRSGFAQRAAEVGDTVTILGNRSLDENENLIKAVRITIEGQNYDMYPERIEG